MHHTAHGGDGGAPDGHRMAAPASAAVGTVGIETTALLHEERWGCAQHRAARLPEGH